MNKTRIGAAVLGALSLTTAAMMFTAPAASAAPQANQLWFSGYENNSQIWLGNPTDANKNYGATDWQGKIYNYYSGKCMDVAWDKLFGNSTGTVSSDPSGTQIEQWTCHSYWSPNQEWAQNDNGDGSWSYFVQNNPDIENYAANGQPGYWCMDSLGGHNYDGSPVEVFACNGINPQKWTIGPSSQLQSVGAPGKCLDDTNWSTYDGNGLQIWDCAY
jgi:hypothetical protein